MGLTPGQRQILDAIENELRITDPGLIIMFRAFTSVTRYQGMPSIEQLAHGAD
jgi:hypothetical protein